MFRVAHFSDFHIDDDNGSRIAIKMIKDAVARGADHIFITGDLLARANMALANKFWRDMSRKGWARGNLCTYVPGNHDIYAGSDKFLDTPGRALLDSLPVFVHRFWRSRARLAKMTESTRRGECVKYHNKSDVFGIGKILAGGTVALASADTTRKGKPPLWRWQEGELSVEVRSGIRRFFGKHKDAPHRILAMHHSPFDEEIRGPFNQLFAEPSPATILTWIKSESMATLVCCGHIHQVTGIRKERLGRRCHVLRAGTAGGMHGDKRVYFMLELRSNGAFTSRRIVFPNP